MKYLVCTTKRWNIEAYGQRRGSNPDWGLITDSHFLNNQNIPSELEWIFFPHWSLYIGTGIREAAKCVIFHTASLPDYRGSSSIQHQILDGVEESEICALSPKAEFDTGPIYMRRPIKLKDRKADDIFWDFAYQTHDMMDEIIKTNPEPKRQVGKGSSRKRRTPEQSRLPWTGDLTLMYNHIRAMDAEGYPKAFLELGDFRLEFEEGYPISKGTVTAHVRITKR
jgi:methionyl-tRNA formyltransferase